LQLFELLVELFHSVVVLLARVADELRIRFVIKIEHESRAEEFALVQDLVLHHDLLKLYFKWNYVIFVCRANILVPDWDLVRAEGPLIAEDRPVDGVVKHDRALVVPFDAQLVEELAVNSSV